MVFTTLTPFPWEMTPMANVQGVSYADGTTWLRELAQIKNWLNDTLVPETNDGIANAVAEFQAGIANAEQTITDAQALWVTDHAAAVAGWQAAFNTLQADYNAFKTSTTADITAEKVEWQAAFDQFMVDVTAQLAALNDAAVGDLIDDGASVTRTALDTAIAGETAGKVNRDELLDDYTAAATPNRDAYSGATPTVWENLGYVLSLTDMRAAMASKLKQTIYQPWVIRIPDGTPGKLGDYYAYWSTDHDNNTGGIWVAYADHPAGPWTWYPHPNGWTFADTGSGRGNQTETPAVIHFLGTFWLYYQQKGAPAGLGVQTTLVASSPDGLTWTKLDKGLLWPSLDLPGDGHTGYCAPYVLGNRLIAFSSASGTNYSRQAIWHSMDAQNWTLDKNLFVIRVSDSQNNVERLVWSPKLFEWRGELWGSFVIKSSSSGLDDPSTNQAFVAKMRKDLRGIDGPMYPTQAAGSSYIEHGGELYTFGAYYNKANLADNNGGMQVSRLVTK